MFTSHISDKESRSSYRPENFVSDKKGPFSPFSTVSRCPQLCWFSQQRVLDFTIPRISVLDMGGTSVESDLVKLSTFQVWQIKIISLVLGLWFLCKRTFRTVVGYKSVSASIEKPPACLTDSSIGVHSYIKLKVSYQ